MIEQRMVELMQEAIAFPYIADKPPSRTPTRNPLVLVLLWSLTLAACGDGSSRSPSSPPTEPSGFDLDITFPPDGASTEGVAAITVSGTLEASGGGPLSAADIQSFSVNNVPATVDFKLGRWHAEIPLGIRENVALTASLEPTSGRIVEVVSSVYNTPLQGAYELIRLFDDGNSALVYGSGQLRRLDLASGAETPVIDGLVDGYRVPATGIRMDATASNAYLLRWDAYGYSPDAYTVDLGDGTGRSLGFLYYPSDFVSHHGFDLDPVNMQLVYSRKTGDLHGIEGNNCRLMAIPLTGPPLREIARTSHVSDLPGAPPVPFCPGPVVIDATNNRAIVAADEQAYPEHYFPDPEDYGLYAYDLATGSGSVLSNALPESGPLLYSPEWLFLSHEGGRVLAVDEERILWVDLASGDRSLAVDEPNMPDSITDVDYDETGQRLVIASEYDHLSALSLVTGDRQELMSITLENAIGGGPEVPGGALSVADSERNRLYVFDERKVQLVSIDLDTLERTLLAAKLQGGAYVPAAALHPTEPYLYYISHNSALMRVNVETGVQEVVSSDSIGGGINLRQIAGLSVDAEHGLIYASGVIGQWNRNGLVSVDIATGARKLVADIGNIDFDHPSALKLNLYSASQDRVIATTQGGNVIAINVHSGQRSPIYAGSGEESIESIAWDSTPGRILVGFDPTGFDRYSPATSLDIRSIDLESGTPAGVLEGAMPFAFDSTRALIYNVGDLLGNGETGQAYAIDRYTGAVATIARLP
ncbi:PQQ-binding-like beta-propeller repeat protein [Pseudohalioglobus lutimaris]|uniref:Uncharacterized protein n=1 Tax=Pseudohalioglobus lutimaris TaxID=1737061 RepID=A0A2N5X655_9GAMM|nr:PQQ-binding-like beta-propeller repeat protein [Pseudohalioglobus lutimaris]PLW69958.1 hypothetical protein C0039_05420 [Pseudohalioglobus lutimaris]